MKKKNDNNNTKTKFSLSPDKYVQPSYREEYNKKCKIQLERTSQPTRKCNNQDKDKEQFFDNTIFECSFFL